MTRPSSGEDRPTTGNHTRHAFPLDHCIHHLVEASAALWPDRIALQVCQARGENLLVTYRELNERANRVADRLTALGVGPEMPVAVCLPHSVEMFIGLLGVLKAGGAYVPLDASDPQDRLAHLLKASAASILLTRGGTSLPPHDAFEVCLRRAAVEEGMSRNPRSGVSAKNPAYIMYTSGSTGKPKGVIATHRGLVNHVLAVNEHFNLTPDDRVLQFSSFSYDVSIEELFPTWVNGATLVVGAPGGQNFGAFVNFLERQQVSVLNLSAAFWRQWVDHLDTAPAPQRVRLVLVDGGKLEAEKLAAWRQKTGDRTALYNAYGHTEVTITATLNRFENNDPDVPIGKPLANIQTHILNAQLEPLPVGEPGELYIAGECLTRGYLQRFRQTAQAFIPNPFATTKGERLYKTGDLVRRREDGSLVFLNRL